MKIDAQAYANAVTPPTFRAQNGKDYVGNILSFDQIVLLQPKLQKLSQKDIKNSSLKEQYSVIRTITDVIFPKPKWMFWRKPCSYWLMKLPPAAMMKTFYGFLVIAMSSNPSPTTSQTDAINPATS